MQRAQLGICFIGLKSHQLVPQASYSSSHSPNFLIYRREEDRASSKPMTYLSTQLSTLLMQRAARWYFYQLTLCPHGKENELIQWNSGTFPLTDWSGLSCSRPCTLMAMVAKSSSLVTACLPISLPLRTIVAQTSQTNKFFTGALWT